MVDLAPGTELDGYRVATVLGRGGMGVVYLAHQLALDRRVALKVINPDLSDDPEFRERFSGEARLAAAIDHRHIIPVYDAGDAGGRLFISMRYVPGRDLGAVLAAEGPLDPARALDIAGALADALDAAHEAGLVHRDVKPANVLIEDGPEPEPDRVYLTDFGLTKRISAPTGLTRTGLFVGTPDYASPEQCSGRPVDGRTDQYSMACVLHECLTGAKPFPRDSDAEVMAAHLREPPPPASALRPGLPAALDAVLARGMAKDPAARFATCGDLVDAAREALRPAGGFGSTVVAPPPAPLGTPAGSGSGSGSDSGGFAAAAAGAPTAPVPVVQVQPTVVGHRRDDDHPRPRRRGLLVVALILLVLGVGTAAVVLATSGGSGSGAGPSVTPTSGGAVTPSSTSAAPPSSGPSPTGTSIGGGADLTAYTNQVDALLAESQAFRTRLVDAVVDSGSSNPSSPQQDASTVRDVIAERVSAVQRVSTWAVPTEAGAVNDLLATAFRDAVADDRHYLLLVLANNAHDEAAAKRILAGLEAHRTAVTDPDKDAFVHAYDALRNRAALPPLPPGFSF